MRTSEALWEVFKTTGHIGAYLLYRTYSEQEQETCSMMHECLEAETVNVNSQS